MQEDEEALDTYDVQTWEVRGPLDRAAVVVDALFHGRWTWFVGALAVVLLLAQFAVDALVVATSPFVALFTGLSVVPALALAAWVYRLSEENEPIRTLAVTFVLGALFANFAALFDSAAGRVVTAVPVVGLTLFYFLFVGPVEEGVKWLAVRLWAYRRSTFDHVVDGAVYGAAAGLGFASIENVIYVGSHVVAVANAAHSQSVLAATLDIASVRALAGPGHVIYSTFAGYYLGLAKYNPGQRGPIVVKGLLVAAGVHGLYDTLVSLPFFASPLAFFGFVVVFDGFFGLLIYRKLARYRRTRHRLDAMRA